MEKDFFASQAAERRVIWVIAAVVFLAYYAMAFVLTYGVMLLFNPYGGPSPATAAVFAGALAAWSLAIQLWFAHRYGVRVILDSLAAKEPDPEDAYHQRLEAVVEELGVAAGGLRARVVIIPTPAVNAFALSDGRQAVIGMTEGIVSRLNRAQTQAVAAHEMAHILNGDCRLATWLCAMTAPLLALAETLDKFNDDEAADHPSLTAAVENSVVALFQMALSRHRETRADAKAVELTRDPLSLAESLYRIAYGNHCLGGPGESLSPIFIVPSRLRPVDEREGLFADLFSSHPPVAKRLNTLLSMAHTDIDTVAKAAEERRSAPPASPMEEILSSNERWTLRSGERKLGPMPLAELAAAAEFGPQSWVCRADADGAEKPAYNDPLLDRFFRLKQQGQGKVFGACPGCGGPLRGATYEGLPVGHCPSCRGYLAGEERAKRLLSRREKSLDEALRGRAAEYLEKNRYGLIEPAPVSSEATANPRLCPSCAQPMTRRHYSYQYRVLVDRCYNCKLVWFDLDELELLQAMVEISYPASPGVQSRPAGTS